MLRGTRVAGACRSEPGGRQGRAGEVEGKRRVTEAETRQGQALRGPVATDKSLAFGPDHVGATGARWELGSRTV